MTDCSGRLPCQYRMRCGLSRPCSGRERVGRPRLNHQEARGFTERESSRAGKAMGGNRKSESAGETKALDHEHGFAPDVTVRPRAASPTGSLPVVLPACSSGRSHLGASFALRCFQRFSPPHVSHPAMPLAGQPAHRRCVHPGPLVLGTAPRKPPTPTTDRDRTVSRRSEPSSRTALMGEQPNPWDLLQPQDATSRHRGAKPCRRCELLGKISLLSPG